MNTVRTMGGGNGKSESERASLCKYLSFKLRPEDKKEVGKRFPAKNKRVQKYPEPGRGMQYSRNRTTSVFPTMLKN